MNCTANVAELDRIAAQMIAAGAGHSAELVLAARRGQISLTALADPNTPAPMKWLRHQAAQPTVCIIGDDPGTDGRGPAGWLAARRLVEWAALAVIHAAGADVAMYRSFVPLAAGVRRLLLIECSTAHADEWALACFRRKPKPLQFVGVVPHEGQHPIVARGGHA
jgi:hypothetical protein